MWQEKEVNVNHTRDEPRARYKDSIWGDLFCINGGRICLLQLYSIAVKLTYREKEICRATREHWDQEVDEKVEHGKKAAPLWDRQWSTHPGITQDSFLEASILTNGVTIPRDKRAKSGGSHTEGQNRTIKVHTTAPCDSSVWQSRTGLQILPMSSDEP